MVNYLGFSEPFSSMTHFAAAGVFVVLAVLLCRRAHQMGRSVVFSVVFSFTTVFLLSMSGVYHLLTKGGMASEVIRRLDHAGIFLLISGTFTAVHGYLFKGFWRWGMLAFIWITAITGITLGTIFFNTIPEWLSLAFYIGLGWFGAVSGFLIWKKYNFSFLTPLLWGAAAYTIGALLEFARFPNLIPGIIGPHEIFHIAVIAGLAFHWNFIFKIIAWPNKIFISVSKG